MFMNQHRQILPQSPPQQPNHNHPIPPSSPMIHQQQHQSPLQNNNSVMLTDADRNGAVMRL